MAYPLELLEAHQGLAKELSRQVQHARLSVSRKLVAIHAGASTKGLEAALDVVEGGPAGAILRVPAGRTGEPRNPARDRLGFQVDLGSCRWDGRHGMSRCGSCAAPGLDGGGCWRDSPHRHSVRVHGSEVVARGAVRDEQLIEIEHSPDVRLRRTAQGAERVNAGGDGCAVRGSGGGGLGSLDCDDDLILADANHVAVLHPIAAGKTLGDRLLVVVEEDAVRAEIFEEKLPVAIVHAPMMGGHVPHGIR